MRVIPSGAAVGGFAATTGADAGSATVGLLDAGTDEAGVGAGSLMAGRVATVAGAISVGSRTGSGVGATGCGAGSSTLAGATSDGRGRSDRRTEAVRSRRGGGGGATSRGGSTASSVTSCTGRTGG